MERPVPFPGDSNYRHALAFRCFHGLEKHIPHRLQQKRFQQRMEILLCAGSFFLEKHRHPVVNKAYFLRGGLGHDGELASPAGDAVKCWPCAMYISPLCRGRMAYFTLPLSLRSHSTKLLAGIRQRRCRMPSRNSALPAVVSLWVLMTRLLLDSR